MHQLRLPIPTRVAVLVSGTGTLLQALLDAAGPDYPAAVVAVDAVAPIACMVFSGSPEGGSSEVIVLTDTATDKVRSLIEQEGVADLALRVAVRPGGCSGFSYEMFFDTDVATDDTTLDYEGVKVVVDPSSAQLLEGATLDYKDGLQGAGFAIDNPNAQRTCGCGQSFS